MVERVDGEIAAAYPGQHMGVARVHGHEAGLHAHLVLPQICHEIRIRQQALERFVLVFTTLHRLAVGLALAHQALHQRVFAGEAAARVPQAIGRHLQLPAMLADRLVGPLLDARVDGGLHHQAIGVDVVVVRVGPVDQPFAQRLRKVRCHADCLVLALKIELDRAFFERLKILVAELVVLVHLRQHGVAAVLRALGVVDRVVVAGALEHAHQGGRLDHVELARRFVEIGARRHLNAEGVVQKGHRVQVGFEDLVLGVGRFDLVCRHRLFELAVERAGAANFLGEHVARQLLRDGGAALGPAHGRVYDRAQGAAPVHAAVFVETVVLGGNQGIDDVG